MYNVRVLEIGKSPKVVSLKQAIEQYGEQRVLRQLTTHVQRGTHSFTLLDQHNQIVFPTPANLFY